MHGYIQVVRAKNRNISVRQEKLQKERTMGNARKPTRKGRYILRAATFVVLSFSFAARISGEPVGQMRSHRTVWLRSQMHPTKGQVRRRHNMRRSTRSHRMVETESSSRRGSREISFLHGHQVENSWHSLLYEITSTKSGL